MLSRDFSIALVLYRKCDATLSREEARRLGLWNRNAQPAIDVMWAYCDSSWKPTRKSRRIFSPCGDY